MINNELIQKEFTRMLFGKQIGRGLSRTVYVLLSDPTLVIKTEIKGNSFQNIREWEYWNEMKGTPVEKWLAPCLFISPCGTVLIQKRCETLDKSKYPSKLPSFFTDTKYQNFGLLNNKFVCFDYGNIPFSKGVNSKTVKANWWGDQEID